MRFLLARGGSGASTYNQICKVFGVCFVIVCPVRLRVLLVVSCPSPFYAAAFSFFLSLKWPRLLIRRADRGDGAVGCPSFLSRKNHKNAYVDCLPVCDRQGAASIFGRQIKRTTRKKEYGTRHRSDPGPYPIALMARRWGRVCCDGSGIRRCLWGCPLFLASFLPCWFVPSRRAPIFFLSAEHDHGARVRIELLCAKKTPSRQLSLHNDGGTATKDPFPLPLCLFF